MPKQTQKPKNPEVLFRDVTHPLFPTADGERWNPREPFDSRQQLISQFLEAHYRINLAYARLLALRKERQYRVPKRLEQPFTERIEKAIIEREKLEDRYASRGVIATPVYIAGFAVDVRFVDAHTARLQNAPVITRSASVRLSIRLPHRPRAQSCKS